MPSLADYRHLASGKVRELYAVDDDLLLMVASDRISAEAHKNETRQKGELGPLGRRLRNAMLSIVLPLFGSRSLDWMYSYRVDWKEPIPSQK